ncbi:MAG: DUF4349 domain-containing protein [Fimbriimonadaceae bacterium]|nr:MAG: DUF4349 domain-containing protein [Fimbriimonadaceae bacterium]
MNEMLKAYLDNELNAEDRAAVEKALAENPELQAELDELQSLSEAIEKGATQIQIKGLEATLSALGKKRNRFAWVRSPYALVAAMTCVVALVMTSPAFMTAGVTAKNEMADMANTASVAESRKMDYAPSESAADAQANSRVKQEAERPQISDGADLRSESKHKAQFGQEEAYSTKPSGGSTSVAQGNPRLIIKNGNIQLLVKNLESTYKSVEDLAKANGGFVESGDRSKTTQSKYGSLSIRVDSKKFDQTMQSLRLLGDVQSESNSGEDVTAVVADAEARLKQMRLEEKQYQEVLKQAKKVSDILEVKRYISEIRQQIEGTEAQINAMRGMATLSTIYVGLEERLQITSAPRRDWLSNSWIRAINRFTGITRSLVSFALNIVILAPFWLPVVIALWIWRRRAMKK